VEGSGQRPNLRYYSGII